MSHQNHFIAYLKKLYKKTHKLYIIVKRDIFNDFRFVEDKIKNFPFSSQSDIMIPYSKMAYKLMDYMEKRCFICLLVSMTRISSKACTILTCTILCTLSELL